MKSLNRNMSTLGTSLERLSTGFRINSGKDDPAGLMASELLRSEITGVETGIKNTSRANSMIAVADSALGEVSRLLNEIRGLVTESANTGIMTEEMLYANQLQIDASLQAINRIAALTSFMGRNLLDGSLDVITTGVDRNALNDLQIHEVRFGTDGAPIPVNINVEKAATKAALYYNHAVLPEDITLSIGGNVGYTTQFFEKGTSVVSIAEMVNRLSSATGVVAELGNSAVAGQLLVSSTGLNNDIIIQAGKAGAAAGCIDVKFTPGDSEGIVVEYVESLGEGVPATINVKLRTESWANASAPRVDNTVDAQGNPIPDNNALQFKANTEGSQYNNASVYFVDGRKTQADFLDNGKTSAIGDPYAYYNDGPTRSRGLMGDINGLPGFTDPDTGQPLTGLYATVSASTPGAEYNNTAIQLVEDSARNVLTDGELAKAVYDSGSKMLRVYVNTSLGATFGDVAGAISWEGNFDMDFSDGSLGKNPPTGMAAIKINRADIVPDGAAGTTNTQNSGGDAGSLFIVLDPDKEDGYTANAISSIFNLHSQSSRGSERAADLFDVQPTVDNDGTGVIRLYASEEEKLRGISRKTSFQGVFEGGQTGGAVLSSAREVVTALNNSALWGTTMGENLLADLHVENTNGLYRDASDPPPLTARLAPGNHGLATVSVFEEVAYYGSPYDGTGLQFLGPNDSPKIRFVAEPGTTELSIDRTTAPDTVDYARAILNAKNPNASLLLTAHRKGEIYDDILIQIKKATDDPSRTDVDRAGGWAEYDPGESHAEALLAFNPLGTGVIPNTTFTMTANKRGVDSNNVPITMRSVPDQSERILVSHNPLTGAIDISLNRSLLGQITANDVITEINNADLGFTAALSEASSVDWGDDFTGRNNGTGTFEAMNLTNKPMEVGNTGSTGGHAGTVTVWMTNIEDATVPGGVRAPTANDVISVINRDAVLGGMFTASNYASGEEAGTGPIDFINDDSFVSGGGLIERGALTVHLVTDSSGLVRTTASDLVA
ncbi:MAG TPA: hypothetical protein DEB39_15790, partial [Planctomycetaceae bacterium]|nr:hypothetical protein [Planctomycetaceae bacterium]